VKGATEEEQTKASIKSRNKILFVTPSLANTMFSKALLSTSKGSCFSLVIDKINMHQAFDLDQDLLELAQIEGFPGPSEVGFHTIFTTNNKSDDSAAMDEA
jgi:hypothetical protein